MYIVHVTCYINKFQSAKYTLTASGLDEYPQTILRVTKATSNCTVLNCAKPHNDMNIPNPMFMDSPGPID